MRSEWVGLGKWTLVCMLAGLLWAGLYTCWAGRGRLAGFLSVGLLAVWVAVGWYACCLGWVGSVWFGSMHACRVADLGWTGLVYTRTHPV
jgi:hypothetical protein